MSSTDTIRQEKISRLLFYGGVIGALFGILSSTWQAPVETAQVLLGWVNYKHSALSYAYHVSVFSLVNYIACLFLALTGSEAISSILLACMMGAISMQALALAIYVVDRDINRALVLALLLGAINYFGNGLSYPIIFMGTEHTYGRGGLILTVYAISLLGLGYYRAALFMVSLALGVHPTWGVWLNGCLVLILVMRFKEYRPLLITRRNLTSYLLGLLLVASLFVWQKWNFPYELEVLSSETREAHEIFLSYINNWDTHRQKFSSPPLLFSAFVYSAIALYFSIFILKHRGETAVRLFGLLIVVSTVLSTIFVFVPSWFDPSYFPESFVTLMPGRFINLSLFMATPLCFAYVSSMLVGRSLVAWYLALLAALTVIAIYSATPASVKDIRVAIGSLLCGASAFTFIGNHKRAAFVKQHPYNLEFKNGTVVALGLFFLCTYSTVYLLTQREMLNRFDKIIVPNMYPGGVLTTFDKWLLQIEIRRPVISPHLDGYPYLGGAALSSLNRLTTDVYGVSIKNTPDKGMTLHASAIATKDYRALWGARNCEDWEKLALKYGFNVIVVPTHVHLALPKIAGDRFWNQYQAKCAV